MNRIYADNAATTALCTEALQAMLPFFQDDYGNPSSLHRAGQEAAEAVQQARQSIAEVLGAQRDEIYFTSGGSEADNWAIFGAAELGAKKGKKHIISSTFEHHAVLHSLDRLADQGFDITLLDVHEDGLVRLEEVAAALREDTALVTIMYANNEIGTIQPIAEIGKLCHSRGVLFHTDAVQAVGHVPIDVVEENIDMLSFSAHKFHGPKGIGALYCRKGLKLPNLINGGAQERGRRAGTENVPGIVGTAVALKLAVADLAEKTRRISDSRDQLIAALAQVPHSRLNGHPTRRLANNINFCFEGIEGESLLLWLDQAGICASSGSACTSGSLDPSHVLLAIGLPHEIAHGSLRLSISEYTTAADIEYMCQKVPEIVAYLRSFSPVWEKIEKGEISYAV